MKKTTLFFQPRRNMEKQSVEKSAKTPSEDRLVMLNDGIFAIATTLLVLDIKIPNGLNQADFDTALMGNFLTQTIMYVVTFLVICGYWINHRQLMNIVKRIDRRFIWLNLLFLAFIAFFPVTSNLVGTYGHLPQAVFIYTLVLVCCGFCALFLWLYATGKHRLIDATLDQGTITFRMLILLIAPAFFLLSLILLLFPAFPPNAIFFTWILVGPIQFAVRRRYRQRMAKKGITGVLSYDD